MLQVPLFPGVPGGPELVIIFLVILLVFGPVVLGVVVLLAYLRRKEGRDGGQSERIADLEARIDELEAGGDGGASGRPGDAGRSRNADGLTGDADRRATEEN